MIYYSLGAFGIGKASAFSSFLTIDLVFPYWPVSQNLNVTFWGGMPYCWHHFLYRNFIAISPPAPIWSPPELRWSSGSLYVEISEFIRFRLAEDTAFLSLSSYRPRRGRSRRPLLSFSKLLPSEALCFRELRSEIWAERGDCYPFKEASCIEKFWISWLVITSPSSTWLLLAQFTEILRSPSPSGLWSLQACWTQQSLCRDDYGFCWEPGSDNE